MKLRIRFSKKGAVRYIGHLDLMRFFQKMIRRADLDIAYSKGYSPHQIMSFAAPLGVGIQSNGEYVDIEMNSIRNDSATMIEKLNSVSVPGIEIMSIKKLPEGCRNAMASVAAASYHVNISEDKFPLTDYASKLTGFIGQAEIPFEKQTKKSTLTLDLKQGILDFRIEDDSLLYFLLKTGSVENIKPQMILQAFLRKYELELPENSFTVLRDDIYQFNSDNSLISMGDIGEEIIL